MRLGDMLTLPLVIGGTHYGPAWAAVVYIHPAGRFYTARIQLPGGSFNECFRLPLQPVERTEHEDDCDHE